jgi:hypothetical protein
MAEVIPADESLSGPVLDFIHGAGGGEKVGSR